MDDGKVNKKSSIEQSALINEVIKRDKRFYSINTNFHLNPKTRKFFYLYYYLLFSY